MTSLAAPRTRRTKATVIRRMLDQGTGELVTYLELKPLLALVPISATTLLRWIEMGHVRVTEPLRGCRNYAVADVVRLRQMTLRQSQDAGILRTPARLCRAQTNWYIKEQYDTLKSATDRNQPWDDYDYAWLIAAYTEGQSTTDMAKHLNRTYAGIEAAVTRLRAAGDLPSEATRDGWLEPARQLLTAGERATL